MRIAVAVWEGRISPVFDAARWVLIVEREKGREIARSREWIESSHLPWRLARLEELGVDTLLCGAISGPFADMILDAGITVRPFLTGEAEDVLAAYITGTLDDTRFVMPGSACHLKGFQRNGGRGSRGLRGKRKRCRGAGETELDGRENAGRSGRGRRNR